MYLFKSFFVLLFIILKPNLIYLISDIRVLEDISHSIIAVHTPRGNYYSMITLTFHTALSIIGLDTC